MLGAGLIAKIAASAVFGRAKAIISKVPTKVWIALGVLILLLLAAWWHERHSQAMLRAAYEQGQTDKMAEYKAANDKLKKEAADWKNRYQNQSLALSNIERKLHDETLRSNAARADALRVRGPGAARACPRPDPVAGLPASSGRNESPAGRTDAEGLGVPSDQWATVPWAWLTDRAESYDANRDEVLRWRNWYQLQKKLYDESRRALEEKSVK